MKKILTVLTLVMFTVVSHSQSTYKSTFNDLDGKRVSLSRLMGKKLLFIITPLSADSSALLDQLDNFQSNYGTNAQIIGIVSKEDGYDSTQKTNLKNLYQNRGLHIILTEPMLTHRSAGADQAPLMQWLMDLAKSDAEGIGTKYFVSASGNFLGILPAATSLNSEAAHQIINQ